MRYLVEAGEGLRLYRRPDGAGKTTFAKHLNGLLRPTRGRVLVGGKDTREYRVAELAREMGPDFQNPDDQLFRSTVEEEVRFGPDNVGAGPEEASGRYCNRPHGAGSGTREEASRP